MLLDLRSLYEVTPPDEVESLGGIIARRRRRKTKLEDEDEIKKRQARIEYLLLLLEAEEP